MSDEWIWNGRKGLAVCICCKAMKTAGHYGDCELAALLHMRALPAEHERSEAEKIALRPRLEALSERLCQTQPFLIGALHDVGLAFALLSSAGQEGRLRPGSEAAGKEPESESPGPTPTPLP